MKYPLHPFQNKNNIILYTPVWVLMKNISITTLRCVYIYKRVFFSIIKIETLSNTGG